ncbi:hypothetical protein H0H87_008884 [Tephrocybe sp. NHM501043]|nr:hypothetical protein H0H87_008884 [Tephrocybe sp. NHM501043]
MVVVNVISVGHISTEALAAISLGTMTAAVTGLSLLNGLSTALETVLPAAFTSSQPQLVGLWAQRMGMVFPSSPNLSLKFQSVYISGCDGMCIGVWGPEAIRLGFIGAPIATTASFYLIAIISYIHGAYLLPRTAWHPLSMKMFSDLGLLVRLGLSGVGTKRHNEKF